MSRSRFYCANSGTKFTNMGFISIERKEGREGMEPCGFLAFIKRLPINMEGTEYLTSCDLLRVEVCFQL